MASKNGFQLPDFLEVYAPLIDWDLVSSAIIGTSKMLEWDIDDAFRLIQMAGERWGSQDIEELKVEAVEKKLTIDMKHFPYPMEDRLIIDVLGEIKPSLINKELKPFIGSKFVLDWKTSKNTLDTVWKERLKDSWQWRIYAYANPGTRIILYRGLSRSSSQSPTKEVILQVPDDNDQMVQEYLTGVHLQRDVLIDAGLQIWPKHMPSSCHAYGRECEYFQQCRDNTSQRKIPEKKPLSYTSIENFLLCPEKYRIASIATEKGDREETEFGKAVHRGLAELYFQLFSKFGQYKDISYEKDEERG